MKSVPAILIMVAVGALSVQPSFAQSSADDITDAIPLGSDSTMKGFRVPTYDDQNVMTSQIYGDSARVLPDGNVEITGLRMEFFSYEGEGDEQEKITDMTVTSPLCYYNRTRGVVISDSDVRISRDQMVVTGKGFRYSNKSQELKILSNSKVVLKGATSSDALEVDTGE